MIHNYCENVKRVSQNSSFFNVKDIWKPVLNHGVHLSPPRFGKLQNSIKKIKKNYWNTIGIVGDLIIMVDWMKIMDSTHKIKEMPNDALLVRINSKNQTTFQISVSKLAGLLWTSIHFFRVITFFFKFSSANNLNC